MSGPVWVRLEMTRMVAQRLERLSADSTWAHVASGHRGSLLRVIDRLEREPDMEGISAADVAQIDRLIDRGLYLLAQAAREIGDPELSRGLPVK
jgi:hypothetical protein